MVLGAEIVENSSKKASRYKPVTVEKNLDLVYDLGSLSAMDNNDFDTKKLGNDKETYLKDLARDNTQLLLIQLLHLPTKKAQDAIMVKLPPRTTKLPCTASKPNAVTKWQRFAKYKGIKKRKKSKLPWSNQLQRRNSLYGFQKSKTDWLLEVAHNVHPNKHHYAKKAKSENTAKNQLQRFRNIVKARRITVPKIDVRSSDNLQNVTIPEASVAPLPKSQDILPPGTSRKRKMSHGSGEVEENLNIMDSSSNKRMRK